MNEFWKLLRESVILQGFLTLSIWVSIIYMLIAGIDVPNELYTVGYTIVGFWFGTKVQSAIDSSRRES